MKPLHEKNPCNYEVIGNNGNQHEDTIKEDPREDKSPLSSLEQHLHA